MESWFSVRKVGIRRVMLGCRGEGWNAGSVKVVRVGVAVLPCLGEDLVGISTLTRTVKANSGLTFAKALPSTRLVQAHRVLQLPLPLGTPR